MTQPTPTPIETARAFAYLTAHSAKNRFLSRVRRAKNPRYALAVVLGAGYLWLVYGRQFLKPRSTAGAAATTSSLWLIIGTALLLVMTAIAWFLPNGPSNLALDKAETTFIVPGPVSSRQLIFYKLMRAQLAVLMTVIVWTVLLRRGSGLLPLPLRAIGVWMFFTTTNLHRTGAEIVRAAWAVRGGDAMRKHWAPTGVVIVTIIGLAVSLGLGYNTILAAWNGDGFKPAMEAVARAMDSGPAVIVLWPIHAVLGPMIAASAAQWAAAIPWALLMLALHLAWVFRADDEAVSAAVIRATERTALIRTQIEGRKAGAIVRPKPNARLKTMPLASTGWAGMAIVWKNTLAMRRKTRSVVRLLAFMLFVPLIWAVIAGREGGGVAAGVAIFALGIAAILLFMGPLMIRTDLRDDMLNLVSLKLIPLSGRTIVAAEILSVVAPLAAVQWALVAMGAGAQLFLAEPVFGSAETLAILAGGLPALVVFNAAFVGIQNAAPVLFPAWTKLGALSSGGMEAMGQMIIVVGLVLILLVLMLLAPVAIGGAIVFVARTHLAPALFGGIAAGTVVLAGEVFALIAVLGRTLERTEPSDVTA